jgi:hypothetical protein
MHPGIAEEVVTYCRLSPLEADVDVVTDPEYGKLSFLPFAKERLSGFESVEHNGHQLDFGVGGVQRWGMLIWQESSRTVQAETLAPTEATWHTGP